MGQSAIAQIQSEALAATKSKIAPNVGSTIGHGHGEIEYILAHIDDVPWDEITDNLCRKFTSTDMQDWVRATLLAEDSLAENSPPTKTSNSPTHLQFQLEALAYLLISQGRIPASSETHKAIITNLANRKHQLNPPFLINVLERNVDEETVIAEGLRFFLSADPNDRVIGQDVLYMKQDAGAYRALLKEAIGAAANREQRSRLRKLFIGKYGARAQVKGFVWDVVLGRGIDFIHEKVASLFVKKIKVTYIDKNTGKVIARFKQSLEELPESFSHETTLHTPDGDWRIVSADPVDRAQIAKAGRLTLRMFRIVYDSLENVLFSLPSICDRVPGPCPTPVTGAECILHEDDWRQFELVANENSIAIKEQFAAIRKIHEDHSAEIGWEKVHNRTAPDPPIPGSFTIQRLQQVLGEKFERAGVTFIGEKFQMNGGFSLKIEGEIALYGELQDDNVIVLGISEMHCLGVTDESINALVKLAQSYDLELVHWCRCQRANPTLPAFSELIRWGLNAVIDE